MSCYGVPFGMVGGAHSFMGGVHRNAAAFDGRCRLVSGCFSRDRDENRNCAARFGAVPDRVYADYREMARREGARADGIKFVSVVTPNASHYEIAKEFLLNGIGVMCEKPLCLEVPQALELQELSEKKGLLFAVGYTYMGFAMVKLAKRLVTSGKIGRIIGVNAQYLQDWLFDSLNGNSENRAGQISIWRTDPKIAGVSNCVGDIGSHIEYTVRYITGLQIKRVSAAVDRFGGALDLNANILVEFDNGAHGNYCCSQVSAGHSNDLVIRIFGSGGSLEWQQENPELLRVSLKGQPTELIYRGAGQADGRARAVSRLPSGHTEGFIEAFSNIYASFASAVSKKSEGEDPSPSGTDYPTARDGLEGVRFIHAVIESGDRDSKWISLE